jgi:hypothetical protein
MRRDRSGNDDGPALEKRRTGPSYGVQDIQHPLHNCLVQVLYSYFPGVPKTLESRNCRLVAEGEHIMTSWGIDQLISLL